LEIGDIQLTIEKAVRKHFPAERVIKVIEATFKDAVSSDKAGIACRKLIFEYFIQKPKTADEETHTGQSITIKIENATFKAQNEPGNVIDVESTEVKDNG
jgi:3-hydroxymyristoyl/3-hydroxydecanoyl-(acyl carrier protein) dehydratase